MILAIAFKSLPDLRTTQLPALETFSERSVHMKVKTGRGPWPMQGLHLRSSTYVERDGSPHHVVGIGVYLTLSFPFLSCHNT
jgi:hypothetical protein